MICKYVLVVSGVPYEIPKSCIKNWDEIKISRKRTGLEGITRAFTSKFEFVNEAYDIILNEYLEKYLDSYASIAVYSITDQFNYKELFSCNLDFSTFSHDGYTVTINSVDDSISNIIKANKGTQYEYPVNELKESVQLYYNRLPFNYFANYIFGGFSLDDGEQYVDFIRDITGKTIFQSLPLEIVDKDIPKSESAVEVNSVTLDTSVPSFVMANKTVTISIKPEFDFYLGRGDVMLTLAKVNKEGEVTSISSWLNDDYSGTKHTTEKDTYKPNQYKEVYTIQLLEGEGLQFVIHDPIGNMNITGKGRIYFTKFSMKIKWTSIASAIRIDVIKPVTILNKLLKSMNGEKEGITGEIMSGFDSRLDECLLLAAESIRGIAGAKLYTSYAKFVDWMEACFGFVQRIEGNIVKFVHRDSLFSSSDFKDLSNSISDFNYKIDSSRIYSRVKVGYDKVDYESINGRDEFRFTVEYTTGIEITDNVLELISPYRADAYGVEFLAQKRSSSTTDDQSDNDVFCVGARLGWSTLTQNYDYILIRNTGWNISGVLNPDTMFNVMFWQRAMLSANMGYIGMFAKCLKYASSDGNSDVVVNGEKLVEDFIAKNHLVTCGNISFKTFREDISPKDDDLILIEKDGLIYEGYIKDIENKIEKSDGIKYELFVKNIR